jgi:SAM-dependent methyltransferase
VKRTKGASKAAKSAWYERWFGEEYLHLYPHRDESEARESVQLVLQRAQLEPGARVLDLACGAGRHLREFRALGTRACGLDLSLSLLQRARSAGLPVARGDMRVLPFAARSFALVTSFFTSFGYFPEVEQDLQVLAEVRRVLRPHGTFVFDFLNSERVRSELPARDERLVDGRRVIQSRSLVENGRVVEKRIEILGSADPFPHIFYERVRLYSPAELRELLAESGLQVVEAFGSYRGNLLTPESPRVILLGRAV